jgi:hypothetical protein
MKIRFITETRERLLKMNAEATTIRFGFSTTGAPLTGVICQTPKRHD